MTASGNHQPTNTTQLESQIQALESSLNTVTTEVDGIDTTALEQAISDNATDIDDLQNASSFSGDYNDLTNQPTIPPDSSAGVATNATAIADLQTGKADVGDVFSGDYNDLTNQPTIPPDSSAGVSTNATAIADLQTGKADVGDVFSGDYNDLTNQPTIPPDSSAGVATNATAIAQLQTDVSDLQTTVTQHGSDISTLQTSLSTNTGALSSLISDLSALTTAHGTLDTQVQTMQSALEALITTVDDLIDRVTVLEPGLEMARATFSQVVNVNTLTTQFLTWTDDSGEPNWFDGMAASGFDLTFPAGSLTLIAKLSITGTVANTQRPNQYVEWHAGDPATLFSTEHMPLYIRDATGHDEVGGVAIEQFDFSAPTKIRIGTRRESSNAGRVNLVPANSKVLAIFRRA